MKVFRDYNIINNQYWVDHKEKNKLDRLAEREIMNEKYDKTHNFNYLNCEYYDPAKEAQFQRDRIKAEQEHGKNFNDRLPPTLKVRETIVFDPYKEVPEEVKQFDLRKKNQKKRYELRYQLEDEYRDRDVQRQEKEHKPRWGLKNTR